MWMMSGILAAYLIAAGYDWYQTLHEAESRQLAKPVQTTNATSSDWIGFTVLGASEVYGRISFGAIVSSVNRSCIGTREFTYSVMAIVKVMPSVEVGSNTELFPGITPRQI